MQNLDSTVAFAGNFVDDANLERALVDLKLMGLNQGERMMESFVALDEIDFDDATDLDDDAADADADAPLDPRDLVVAIDAHLARRPWPTSLDAHRGPPRATPTAAPARRPTPSRARTRA